MRSAAPIMLFLVAAFGAVFWCLAATHPTAVPAWGPSQFSVVEYLATASALIVYARGFRLTERSSRPHFWRLLLFIAGVGVSYAVVQTRLAYFALHSFMMTQAQLFVLHDLGPVLIALSRPGLVLRSGLSSGGVALANRAGQSAAFLLLQHPTVALALFVGLLGGSLVPAVVFTTMLSSTANDGMNIAMLVDGLLFWFLVLDPRAPGAPASQSYGVRAALIAGAMLPVMPLGAWLAFTGRAVYASYDLCGRVFPTIDALRDQRLGALILWIPSGLMSAALILVPLDHLRRREETQSSDRSGSGLIVNASAWTGR